MKTGRARNMTDKQLVIDAVSRLPDATPIEAIQEEVEILAAIRRGQEAADAGHVTPHDQVKKLMAQWSSK
jgi:predicted transcriptional regulator